MKNLILLHGALGNIALFNPLVNELKNDFHCHVLNFNGHGNSPMKEEFSIEEFSLELNAFIDDNALEDCLVFGHSMGGYVALLASASGNQKIKKIITLGTKFLWTNEIAENAVSFFDIEKMKLKVPSFVDQLKNAHSDNWERLVLNIKELLLKLGANPPLKKDVLQKINIPVILCLGDKDNTVSEKETKETQQNIPQSNLIILPGQAHSLEGVDVQLLKKLIIENA